MEPITYIVGTVGSDVYDLTIFWFFFPFISSTNEKRRRWKPGLHTCNLGLRAYRVIFMYVYRVLTMRRDQILFFFYYHPWVKVYFWTKVW